MKGIQHNSIEEFNFPANASSAVEAVNRLLIFAVGVGASDIHIDERDVDVIIRLRIDGIVEKVGHWPKSIITEVVARLKILAGARTDIHYIPQDGRWLFNHLDKQYNIRASFMPTYYGESVVLRILPKNIHEDLSFAKLGFSPDHVKFIADSLNKTSGLILVTGPTGSGKTTTLHTCLNEKSKEPISVVTLEDPIEYEVPNVRQIHIRHSHGVSFSSGLRACLRQDPDVIMIGEIRDNETAKVAVHTALTGHLVFSTLHTNSALEAIPRLRDMGVDHYLLASTLRLIIAQRLIRLSCKFCGSEGCVTCHYSGYKGRTVMAEICEIDNIFRQLISCGESFEKYKTYAESRGFKTMIEDGLEKVEWGVTTKTEVLRVLY